MSIQRAAGDHGWLCARPRQAPGALDQCCRQEEQPEPQREPKWLIRWVDTRRGRGRAALSSGSPDPPQPQPGLTHTGQTGQPHKSVSHIQLIKSFLPLLLYISSLSCISQSEVYNKLVSLNWWDEDNLDPSCSTTHLISKMYAIFKIRDQYNNSQTENVHLYKIWGDRDYSMFLLNCVDVVYRHVSPSVLKTLWIIFTFQSLKSVY